MGREWLGEDLLFIYSEFIGRGSIIVLSTEQRPYSKYKMLYDI